MTIPAELDLQDIDPNLIEADKYVDSLLENPKETLKLSIERIKRGTDTSIDALLCCNSIDNSSDEWLHLRDDE